MSDELVDDEEWEYPAPEGSTEVEPEAPAEVEAAEAGPEPPRPPEPEAPRQPEEWRRAIEAVLMAATEPVEPQVLAQLIERPVAEVEGLCALLAAECSGRGYILVKVAGGYRFQTHPDLAPYVERYLLEGRHARLSSAALETLAVIAYKQPVTSPEITEIRGVNTSGVLATLMDRKLVRIVGRKQVVGRPFMYGTTREFLERFGLNDLSDLPKVEDMSELLGFDLPGLGDGPQGPAALPFEENTEHRIQNAEHRIGNTEEVGAAGEAGNAGEAGEKDFVH